MLGTRVQRGSRTRRACIDSRLTQAHRAPPFPFGSKAKESGSTKQTGSTKPQAKTEAVVEEVLEKKLEKARSKEKTTKARSKSRADVAVSPPPPRVDYREALLGCVNYYDDTPNTGDWQQAVRDVQRVVGLVPLTDHHGHDTVTDVVVAMDGKTALRDVLLGLVGLDDSWSADVYKVGTVVDVTGGWLDKASVMVHVAYNDKTIEALRPLVEPDQSQFKVVGFDDEARRLLLKHTPPRDGPRLANLPTHRRAAAAAGSAERRRRELHYATLVPPTPAAVVPGTGAPPPSSTTVAVRGPKGSPIPIAGFELGNEKCGKIDPTVYANDIRELDKIVDAHWMAGQTKPLVVVVVGR